MRIYVRQIAGGRMVPLTDEDLGRRTAMAAMVVRRGTDPVPGGTCRGSRPDRREGNGALFVVPALGGVAASNHRRRASRRCRVAGLVSRRTGRSHIGGADGVYVVRPEKPESLTLIAAAPEVHSPAWSPDGRRIVFVSRGICFTFGEESLGNVSTSTISVVGRREPEASRPSRVASGWTSIPVWMPDGRSLLFISSRGGGRDVFRQRFSGGGQPEGEPERISSGLNAHGISLSRDGRLLAYSSYTQRANIWSIAIPEGRIASVREAQQVTFGTEKIEKLAVSWDGAWLAYDSDRTGHPDVWKMPLAGRHAATGDPGPEQQVRQRLVAGWSGTPLPHDARWRSARCLHSLG